MVSDCIGDGVPYAKEVRDLARQAHRLLRKEAHEPSRGDLRAHQAVLRRIGSLKRQLAQERRTDLLRWLAQLSRLVERRPSIRPRSIASR